MVELKGTEKQIVWAEKIRTEVIDQVKKEELINKDEVLNHYSNTLILASQFISLASKDSQINDIHKVDRLITKFKERKANKN